MVFLGGEVAQIPDKYPRDSHSKSGSFGSQVMDKNNIENNIYYESL